MSSTSTCFTGPIENCLIARKCSCSSVRESPQNTVHPVLPIHQHSHLTKLPKKADTHSTLLTQSRRHLFGESEAAPSSRHYKTKKRESRQSLLAGNISFEGNALVGERRTRRVDGAHVHLVRPAVRIEFAAGQLTCFHAFQPLEQLEELELVARAVRRHAELLHTRWILPMA